MRISMYALLLKLLQLNLKIYRRSSKFISMRWFCRSHKLSSSYISVKWRETIWCLIQFNFCQCVAHIEWVFFSIWLDCYLLHLFFLHFLWFVLHFEHYCHLFISVFSVHADTADETWNRFILNVLWTKPSFLSVFIHFFLDPSGNASIGINTANDDMAFHVPNRWIIKRTAKSCLCCIHVGNFMPQSD